MSLSVFSVHIWEPPTIPVKSGNQDDFCCGGQIEASFGMLFMSKFMVLCRWYHGSISRLDAETLLRVHREGSYLVRMSESNRCDYSLSLK